MKKLTFLLTITTLLLGLSGCKTSEANYRAAYEKAKNKGQSTAVDPEVYQRIASEEGPATLTIEDVSFPGIAMYLSTVPQNDIPSGTINRYSVATARFKQTFNAKSMARRLRDNGFEEAFVAQDRNGDFYVIAASRETPAEAETILQKLATMNVGAVAPFPYVVVKP